MAERIYIQGAGAKVTKAMRPKVEPHSNLPIMEGGKPAMVPSFALEIFDPDTKRTYIYAFDETIRDHLVQQMTGVMVADTMPRI